MSSFFCLIKIKLGSSDNYLMPVLNKIMNKIFQD